MSSVVRELKAGEISLENFCSQLSISVATGKNWIKLGKIKPKSRDNIVYFNQRYVNELKKNILLDNNKALKSRRNKKYVSGNMFYRSYVGDESINLSSVENILDIIERDNIIITNDIIRCIIIECAMQMILNKQDNSFITENSLLRYIKNELKIAKYNDLFHFSIEEKNKYLNIIEENSSLFKVRFRYEENKDIMGLLYISLKSLGDRKTTGTYYTPDRIVRRLNSKLFIDNAIKNKIILDPCCGTGNFLLNLPEVVGFEHIFAMDIDEDSVFIAKLNMAIKYDVSDVHILNEHIKRCDFLNFDFTTKYDIILGNPPWGYSFNKDEKKKLCEKFYSAYGNNVESFDLFIEKASTLLNANGSIAFVLPEAVLNVKSHTRIRELLFKSFNIKYVEYLGNAFDKVQCPSIIIILQKTDKQLSTKGTEVVSKGKSLVINSTRKIDANCFSLLMNDFDYSIIEKINSLKNKVYLKDNSRFALGIVTGSNEKFISNYKSKDNEMILKGKDIYKFSFADSKEYIDFVPEKYQQVAPIELYRAPEKLFYRFISNKLVFAYDDNQTLSLNSCNILIPLIKDVDIKYILAVLNSRVVQFYYDSQFNSIKVLRTHLESIPLPYVVGERQKFIVSYVDNILKSSEAFEIQRTYDIIDKLVSEDYGISDAEYEYIKNVYLNKELFLNTNL